MKSFFVYIAFVLVVLSLQAWGFFAHMQINRLAIFTLPRGINHFYKSNLSYLRDHATDPDKRRYSDTSEAPRHYIDIELYEEHIDSIPEKWSNALQKYGSKTLSSNGILPWQIQHSYYKLVQAFKEKDSMKILRCSAYLGHYIADAHVPLHTTNNHNGQLSGQNGIHAFWESRLPELFAETYNFVVGQAFYIEDPLKKAWSVVRCSHALTDSVLKLEAALNSGFPAYRKYSFSRHRKTILKQYSFEYSKQYHNLLNKMVERQMRSAILLTGSYWYSAWIDAGQPALDNFKKTNTSKSEKQNNEQLERQYKTGQIIGREN
ncbi:zinc dependent phospholipase C family protein [Pedobacter nutrimenti]|jgi:hypothetical protein|uniref:Zinc dependent phospholipase C n=1 Tax=Pedobacter nutrimenti TaxID=1241337 RepID=A0A318UG10_9SPHI|nr:zinc dependent phospholipase C family protein [Pedobacter nutrimenti]PYF73908.1 zinc dependent phospholipase C [Pedobacter nutrimenti]